MGMGGSERIFKEKPYKTMLHTHLHIAGIQHATTGTMAMAQTIRSKLFSFPQLSRHISSTLPLYSLNHSSTSSSTLAYERYDGINASKHNGIFIHGILGSKKNMRTPAKEFIQLFPNYSAYTLDLRGHGASSSSSLNEGTSTMTQCAKDLERFFSLNLPVETNHIPEMICAHSLGGKVVLKYLQQLYDNGLPLPHNTWILDSLPGKYNFENISSDSQSVLRVLEVLKTIPQPFESRQVVMKTLVNQGISPSIAAWLGTSVIENVNGGSRWAFDLSIIQDLFSDFCEVDMWEFLERYDGKAPYSNGEGGMIHYVRAGRQSKWSPEILEKFERLNVSSGGKIKLHTMPNVGHWLHAEDLPGLLKIMKQNSQLHS